MKRIPILLAAGLAGGETVEMGKPLLAVLLMLLPSVPAAIEPMTHAC